MSRNVYILFAGRFPSEKAAGLFVHLSATSYAQAGATVSVVAPRRLGRHAAPNAPYRTVYIPTLDLSRIPGLGRVSNYITVAVFTACMLLWLAFRSGKADLILSNDVFPLLAASYIRSNTLYEMHDYTEGTRALYTRLFARVRTVLVTNEWKRNKVKEDFGIPDSKLILVRNAVDTNAFGSVSMGEARRRLGLGAERKMAVYTGHLYAWKGVDTLAAAAHAVPDADFIFVGGTEQGIRQFKQSWGTVPNIRIVGHVSHDQIPLWQAAADVLILPNSAKEEISVHYTSPMKLFEYMASGRPIVASDVPSIREVLPESIGYFAQPDNAESFVVAIRRALSDPQAPERAIRAREEIRAYSWPKRTTRILSLL